MNIEDQLTETLTAIANEQPQPTRVPVSRRLIDQIRRRRRLKFGALTTVGALACVGGSLGVAFGFPPAQQSPLPASPTRSEQPTAASPRSFFVMPDPCGQRVTEPLPSIGLSISAAGSLSVPATTHWSPDKLFASLSITVTNETDSDIGGITSEHPYVVVTNKAGIVVGASSGFRAVATSLMVPAHGRVSMHAPVPLTRCNRAKGSPPGIAPGAYSLWVDIDVSPGDRSTTEYARGGPFPLTIR